MCVRNLFKDRSSCYCSVDFLCVSLSEGTLQSSWFLGQFPVFYWELTKWQNLANNVGFDSTPEIATSTGVMSGGSSVNKVPIVFSLFFQASGTSALTHAHMPLTHSEPRTKNRES